jgi:hypothetical protein
VFAQAEAPAEPKPPEKSAPDKAKKEGEKAKPDEKPKPPEKSFDDVVKDGEKREGLFTLYRVKKDLFAEIRPDQLETPYLLQISRGNGLAERGIVFGEPVSDALIHFRQIGDQIQIVERNTLFRAPEGSAWERSIRRSYADSVLGALKVEATHPERKSVLVNLNSYMLTDLAGIGESLNPPGQPGGFAADPNKSHWGAIKTFPQNLELETVLVFGSSRSASGATLQNVNDARGFEVITHYSLAQLPTTDYRPRVFDPRVGYFVQAFRDYSDPERETPFGRFICRWDIQKRDPTAKLSPPKKPIVFYLENNIPPEHRPAVRDGLLMWNRAFERLGFQDVIEVREQPDNPDWDSNDFRYNTVRWVTSPSAGYAVAQMRPHPITGEIVKANITIDGNWIRYASRDFTDEINPFNHPPAPEPGRYDARRFCDYGAQAMEHLAFGLTALELKDGGLSPEEKKKYVYQSVREMAAHEMGHILGLRHNFYSSSMLTPAELHNTAITRERGVVSSVMDYCPPNIAPEGVKQGDYYNLVVGPYDMWAIEYGYTPISAASPEDESPALNRIANRAAAPELAYGPDEECDFGADPRSVNPLITRFDMSRDGLAWAEQQMRLSRSLLAKMDGHVPEPGKSYTNARRKFARLLGKQLSMTGYITKYVGGIYTSRSFKGDPGAGAPMKPVPGVQQRRALGLIESYLFDTRAFLFPPSLLNKLARETNWHWGIDIGQMLGSTADYPLREAILSTQRQVLARLTHPVLLARIANNELRVTDARDALTLPELLGRLSRSIWSEVQATSPPAHPSPVAGRAPFPPPGNASVAKPISAMRRNLQREHLSMMIGMMLQPGPGTPEDARTLAWAELSALRTRIAAALKAMPNADAYTRAHLAESEARVAKALDARMTASIR